MFSCFRSYLLYNKWLCVNNTLQKHRCLLNIYIGCLTDTTSAFPKLNCLFSPPNLVLQTSLEYIRLSLRSKILHDLNIALFCNIFPTSLPVSTSDSAILSTITTSRSFKTVRSCHSPTKKNLHCLHISCK